MGMRIQVLKSYFFAVFLTGSFVSIKDICSPDTYKMLHFRAFRTNDTM